MTTNIKAVVFDFGGVLVRTEDHSARQRWEQRLGLAEGELSRLVFASKTAYQCSIGEATETQIWEDLGRKLGLPADEVDELRRDFWSGDRLDTTLVEYIAGLRPRFITAILSNAWTNGRDIFTRTHHLDRVMDTMMISAEEGVVKPDPEIYARLTTRLRIEPYQGIFVDDFPENVRGASQYGLHAIHFQSTPQVIQEIEALIHPTTI
ncbi:MAG TPA: HAD family phosphatase [Anaerolineaceae bacterium]|nr:HAD family phosphatase [Anaerolineaceae bacterium]